VSDENLGISGFAVYPRSDRQFVAETGTLAMADLDALRAFVQVASLGGFGRAAVQLGLSKSIVSRRVAALEAELGVRLLNRTTRGVSLTEAGARLQRGAARILAELDEALGAVAGRDEAITGTLRIAAPLSFGIMHLAGWLAEFALAQPLLQLDIAYSDRFVDIIREGFDAALRIGELPSSSLVQRRLAVMRSVVVASPLYLARRGTPRTPSDLTQHEALIYSGSARGDIWRFKAGRGTKSVRVEGRFRADNGEALREAAIAGLGIAALPSWLVAPAVAARLLTPLLTEFAAPETGLYLVRPPGPVAPGKVRKLIDFLSQKIGPEPVWDRLPIIS
jgi:DNA-binding transcriptional LysR family regulator